MNLIEQVIRSINGGCFANVDYSIPVTRYIRKKATDGSNQINPLWNKKDEIRLERENVQINLGVVYEQGVNGRLEKKDIEPDFSPANLEKYGKTSHFNPHKNLCQNLNRTKTYVRYMPMQNKNSKKRFVLNGQDVSETLKPFMAKINNESKSQSKAGLNADEQIQWRTLDIANISKLKVLGAEITQ